MSNEWNKASIDTTPPSARPTTYIRQTFMRDDRPRPLPDICMFPITLWLVQCKA